MTILTILLLMALSSVGVFMQDAIRTARYEYYIRQLQYRKIAAYRSNSIIQTLGRYKRIYSPSRLGSFYYYHQLYRHHSRLLSYKVTLLPYEKTYQCMNFELNSQDDMLGYFPCPFMFEPVNYTECCGDYRYNYCCPNQITTTRTSAPITPTTATDSNSEFDLANFRLILAGIIGCFLALFAIMLFIIGCKKHRERQQSHATVTATSRTPSAGVTVSASVSYHNSAFENGDNAAPPPYWSLQFNMPSVNDPPPPYAVCHAPRDAPSDTQQDENAATPEQANDTSRAED